MNRYFPTNKERFYYRKRNNRLRGRYCVFDFYKEAAATYTKAYNALYRQAVATQFDIQYALLNSGIAAGLALNTSLWGACGTANAAMFASVVENDTLPAVLTYLRSQSQSEIAAMVASAELYGEFQVNWRTDSYTISSVEDALQYAEQQADIAWAQKVAAARNAYYSQLASITTSFNSTVFDALESYNSTLLSAEIARASSLFDAAQSYSIDTYSIEADYAKSQFDTYKEKALKRLDAEIEESDALADLEAYYARKTADEYENICKENEEAEEENEELVDEEGNPVFYVVPDGSERRRQIDSDNYSQLYNFRKEITDKKTADSKKADEDARNAENADRVKYITDKIAVQTTYELAIASAEETYYNTITTADAAYNTAVESAEENFNNEYCRLTGLYYDALQTIDHGGTIEENYYENGTSSLNVQVCFPAGTPVVLADGSVKNIEDIVAGDKVKCAAHQEPMGEVSTGNVVRVFRNSPQSLWRLNFDTFEIRATKEHPFYVKGKGWVTAEELQIGDILRSADDTEIILTAKEFESEEVPVFNFEVEEKHTYFVGENERECVLVHNACWDYLNWGWEVTKGAGAGFITGGKGLANGFTGAAVSTLTIGFVEYNGPFIMTDTDISYGGNISQGFSRASGEILIAVGTGGVASWTSKSGNLRYVGHAVNAYDAVGNTANVVRGSYDIYQNGVNIENTLQVVGGGTAILGNATPFLKSTNVEYVVPNYQPNQMTTVTSWASAGITPDLNPGRWVMLGEANRWNFIRSALWGPKGDFTYKLIPPMRFESSNVPFTNSITGQVPTSSIQLPPGWSVWRGIFGQRMIKPQ